MSLLPHCGNIFEYSFLSFCYQFSVYYITKYLCRVTVFAFDPVCFLNYSQTLICSLCYLVGKNKEIACANRKRNLIFATNISASIKKVALCTSRLVWIYFIFRLKESECKIYSFVNLILFLLLLNVWKYRNCRLCFNTIINKCKY